MLINGYFPCDTQSANFDGTELLKTLQDMKILIEASDCSNIFFAGDLNCHFERNNKFTKLIKNFIDEIPLNVLWNEVHRNENITEVEFTYSFMNESNIYFSTIDHFLVNDWVLMAVEEAGAPHLQDNFSNHCPILCKL